MKTFKLMGESLAFHVTKYRNNNATAVEVLCWAPGTIDHGQSFATLSVNVPGSDALPDGQFYAKHWSDNEDLFDWVFFEGMIDAVKPITKDPGTGAIVVQLTEKGKEYVVEEEKEPA